MERLTPTEQMQFFDHYAHSAYAHGIELLLSQRQQVITEARRRFEQGIGLYGDQSFHRGLDWLDQMILEEAADIVAWGVPREVARQGILLPDA